MYESDLELCTNQQLIDELLRRTTFTGVIISSKEPLRGTDWGDVRMMRVQHSSYFTREEVSRLCDVVGQRIDAQCE